MAPANTARGVSGPLVVDVTLAGTARTPPVSVIGAGFFARIDRVVDFRAFLVFFAGTDILLSESFWSFRSAESTYRIDRGGFAGLCTRTDVLLGETRGTLESLKSKWSACVR
jgi:hypothetical protein